MEFGDLRGILHYVPQFRNKLFVIKIDGRVVHSDNFSNVVLDLAVLHSLKINFIIVHDAQVQRNHHDRHEESDFDGGRPTSEKSLDLELNENSKVTNILMRELTAVGLKVATSNAIIARSIGVIGGVDFPYDGKVEKIDDASLHALLEKNIIPIIPSIGFDTKGRNYLLDSDSLAFSLGLSIGSSKVMMLVEPNLMDPVIGHQYSVSETVDLVKHEKKLTPRLSRILLTAANSFNESIERVHNLKGFRDYAILAELFSIEGGRVMIHRYPY